MVIIKGDRDIFMNEDYIVSNSHDGHFIHLDQKNKSLVIEVKRALMVSQRFIIKLNDEQLKRIVAGDPVEVPILEDDIL